MLCDAIYTGNTQQKPKNIIDDHFLDVQNLPKNGHKSDSFAAHYEKQHEYTTSHTNWNE